MKLKFSLFGYTLTINLCAHDGCGCREGNKKVEGPDSPDHEDDGKSGCGAPCQAGSACRDCEAYWDEMVRTGMWDPAKMQWTDKAFRGMGR